MRSALLVLSVLALGCETYVPPPAIASANVGAGGVFDPAVGALELRLTEGIDPESFELSLYTDLRGREGELCFAASDGRLPDGCTVAAEPIIAPCKLDPSTAVQTETGLRYTCSGGALELDAERKIIRVEPLARYAPYRRYVVELSPRLLGVGGRRTGVPLSVIFQAKGDLPLAPTDFRTGQFFAIIDIFEPIPAQFQFFFYLAVRPETGELRFFAADADPQDASIDPKTNRDPTQWKVDISDTTGATLRAEGQVSDSGGSRLLRIYPFVLRTVTPPVEAPGTEVSARVGMGTVAGGPSEARELVDGTMAAPSVSLGLDAARSMLGPGRGALQMFRLTSAEERPLESLLPAGVDPAVIREPFGP